MTTLSLAMAFRAWKRFRAGDGDYHAFLVELAREAKKTFRRGMQSEKSGVHYRGQRRRSSAAGEYPAVQSGALMKSISTRVRKNEMTIGTSRPYSGYLRDGTSRMAPRKMSDNALQEAIENTRARLEAAHWERGKAP